MKLGEMGRAIRCRSTNESLGLALLVKKISNGYYLFVSISSFVTTVFRRESQSQKGLLSFLHGVTRQFEPRELDNVVSTLVVFMTLTWVKRCYCKNLFSVGDHPQSYCLAGYFKTLTQYHNNIWLCQFVSVSKKIYSGSLCVRITKKLYAEDAAYYWEFSLLHNTMVFCFFHFFVWPNL